MLEDRIDDHVTNEIELRANRLLHLRKIAELVDCPLVTPVRARANSTIGSSELSAMGHPLSISSARNKESEDAAVRFLRFV